MVSSARNDGSSMAKLISSLLGEGGSTATLFTSLSHSPPPPPSNGEPKPVTDSLLGVAVNGVLVPTVGGVSRAGSESMITGRGGGASGSSKV